MSTTTGKHAAKWSFELAIEDAKFNGVLGTGQHRRLSKVEAFRHHVLRRFGSSSQRVKKSEIMPHAKSCVECELAILELKRFGK